MRVAHLFPGRRFDRLARPNVAVPPVFARASQRAPQAVTAPARRDDPARSRGPTVRAYWNAAHSFGRRLRGDLRRRRGAELAPSSARFNPASARLLVPFTAFALPTSRLAGLPQALRIGNGRDLNAAGDCKPQGMSYLNGWLSARPIRQLRWSGGISHRLGCYHRAQACLW